MFFWFQKYHGFIFYTFTNPNPNPLLVHHWIFTPARWSSLGRQQTRIDSETRRNIVFSQVLILTLMGLAVHLVADSWRGDYGVVGFVLITTAVTALSLYWNEQRLHHRAKYFFFSTLNVIFFVLAALVHRECAVNMLLMALMGVSLVVHGQRDFLAGLTFACLALTSLIILEVTDYAVFGSYKILEHASVFNAVINVVSAAVTLTLSIIFLVYQNYRSELGLLKREEQLSRTNAKLDRVLYSASHDLRAPLNSIKGLINVASRESHADTLKQYFALVDDRVAKLDNFVLDILELSKAEKAAIVREEVSIRQLVDEVANSLRYMDGAQKIAMIHEFSDVDFVHTDRKRLSVVLNNLISNAIKYRHAARAQSWVKILVQQKASTLELIVQDNGMGIAQEHQPRVFDMFYRATQQGSGSGLGLFLVKEAIEQLNGNITLHSAIGEGTTFTISLPLN
jgi:signal transduction histidine kinase